MKIKKVLVTAMMASSIAACTRHKATPPATWDDVARTLPANVEYVATLPLGGDVEPMVRNIFGGRCADLIRLIDDGIALCTKSPDHIVIFGTDRGSFVTWPLPNPAMAADNVAKWKKCTLPGDVEGRELVRGNASLVVTPTQAWVVPGKNGAADVRRLLGELSNGTAADVAPLKSLVASPAPSALSVAAPLKSRYMTFALRHGDDGLHITATRADAEGNTLPVVSHTAPLKTRYTDSLAAAQPFVTLGIAPGQLPELLRDAAKYSGSASAKIGVRYVAPLFDKAQGPMTATLGGDELCLTLTFATAADAKAAAAKLTELAARYDAQLSVATKAKVLTLTVLSPGYIDGLVLDDPVPRIALPKGGASAVGMARFAVGSDLIVDLRAVMVNDTATADILYPRTPQNDSMVVEFVKSLIPKQF